MAFHSVISIHRMFKIRLTTLIEQSCKYSNNTVKCYLITTKLALNLTAIKGTSSANSSSSYSTIVLYIRDHGE